MSHVAQARLARRVAARGLLAQPQAAGEVVPQRAQKLCAAPAPAAPAPAPAATAQGRARALSGVSIAGGGVSLSLSLSLLAGNAPELPPPGAREPRAGGEGKGGHRSSWSSSSCRCRRGRAQLRCAACAGCRRGRRGAWRAAWWPAPCCSRRGPARAGAALGAAVARAAGPCAPARVWARGTHPSSSAAVDNEPTPGARQGARRVGGAGACVCHVTRRGIACACSTHRDEGVMALGVLVKSRQDAVAVVAAALVLPRPATHTRPGSSRTREPAVGRACVSRERVRRESVHHFSRSPLALRRGSAPCPPAVPLRRRAWREARC